MLSPLTIRGETKSLKRYATSSGFSFSTYNLFKPSIIDVTALAGIWAREDERGDTLGNKWKWRHPPREKFALYATLYFYRWNIFIKKAIQGRTLLHEMHVREAPKRKAYIVYQRNILPKKNSSLHPSHFTECPKGTAEWKLLKHIRNLMYLRDKE